MLLFKDNEWFIFCTLQFNKNIKDLPSLNSMVFLWDHNCVVYAKNYMLMKLDQLHKFQNTDIELRSSKIEGKFSSPLKAASHSSQKTIVWSWLLSMKKTTEIRLIYWDFCALIVLNYLAPDRNHIQRHMGPVFCNVCKVSKYFTNIFMKPTITTGVSGRWQRSPGSQVVMLQNHE